MPTLITKSSPTVHQRSDNTRRRMAPARTQSALKAPAILARRDSPTMVAPRQSLTPLIQRKTSGFTTIEKTVPRRISPSASSWRTLTDIDTLVNVIAAIQQAISAERTKTVRLVWSHTNDAPAIPLKSLSSLTEAVFGEWLVDFDAEKLLAVEMEKLSKALASEVRKQTASTMLLEGLWLTLPAKAQSNSPLLSVAVSIEISQSKPVLGPFQMSRVYLKIGSTVS